MNMSTPALIAAGSRVGAARHLAVRVPVADDEAVEAHVALEHAGQQRLLPAILTPRNREKLDMTFCTPASIAGG